MGSNKRRTRRSKKRKCGNRTCPLLKKQLRIQGNIQDNSQVSKLINCVIELKILTAIEEPRGEIQQSGSSATGESSQDSATSGTDNKNNEPKFRRSRVNSRRHLSKSEPMGQDGTNDSEDQDVVDSGESQPLLGSGNTVRDHYTTTKKLTDTLAPESTSISS